MSRAILAGILLLVVAAASAQDHSSSAFPMPGEKDVLAVANLDGGERQDVLAQIEKTSFDEPDSWEQELRFRRIPLGAGEALLVRGTNLLCGGTGNCETWLFRRANGRWTNLFGGEAPVLASLGARPHATNGLPDLVATAHVSAQTHSETLYVFDGQLYRARTCAEVTEAGGKKTTKTVRCK